MGSNWTRYYDAAGDEPRQTLLYALARFDEEGARSRLAVDLGCGTGRDAAELLRRGWRVLAIDGEAEAIERLRARRDLLTDAGDRLRTRIEFFDEAEWPEVDLVNSSFALPFCPPDAFPAVWARIGASLRPGGRFAGHLFGNRDEWSAEQDMTFHTRGQVEAMLESLEVEHLEEIEEDGSTATGKKKHWHVFHVVARKPLVLADRRPVAGTSAGTEVGQPGKGAEPHPDRGQQHVEERDRSREADRPKDPTPERHTPLV